ncbi:MAG: 3',5'-cyclic-AMP phosphodiesterase [Pseudomonadales bacterium]
MHIKLDDLARPARVAHITDTHLGEHANFTLLDMETDRSLDYVLQSIEQCTPAPDIILVTGDIADHGSRAAYERLQSKLARFAQPKLWLNGNHDVIDRMRSVVGFGNELARRALIGEWQIIMLDTTLTGAVGGVIARAELEFLHGCLQQRANMFSLICLHHQPVPVGCQWLDEQQIVNADELLGLIKKFDTVRGVLWGHVHQQFEQQRDAVQLMSTPSTCVQFAPGSDDFKVDDKAPGYRWLELHTDGRLETEVRRVEDAELEVDLQSTGY